MSIKKYFENTSLKKTTLNNLESKENIDFESFGYLDELEEQRERFIPNVDFSKPENFARYGLAEQYYQDAADRITNNYPYDGSDQEVTQWYNESTYFDLYIFENEYPRTNGYVVLSADGWGAQTSTTGGYGLPATLEYISIKGGPHSGPDNTRIGANIYSPANKRNSNLALNVSSSGATVEFWLKKDAFITGSTAREVIFDLWNNELSSSTSYGRFRIELNTSSAGNFTSDKAFRLLLQSGSNNQEVFLGDYTTTASFNSQGWKQYAFAVTSGSSKLYINGELDSTASFSTAVGDVSGTLNAYIGALITTPSGSTAAEGSGKLSGSLDEFRYWKIARQEREISRNWFTNVYGGTNTVDANTDLGVYFKFNEGITGVSATDSVVLDYSGRISNGAWTGYTSNSRNVGSAIVSASAAASEFKDPILRTSNSLYTNYLSESLSKGRRHDLNNSSNLYNSFPDWIINEDAQYSQDFKKLIQAVSSYFDTAHLQVAAIPTLKNINYEEQTNTLSNVSKPFTDRLLTEKGMFVPELFIESTVLEDVSQKVNGDFDLETDLFDLKNLIYQNIYNNLGEIAKKKGTKDSIRNTLHAFGVGEELVKLQTYNSNEVIKIEDEKTFKTETLKYINFNRLNNRDASIFQTGSAQVNDFSFISSSVNKDRFTLEATLEFPSIDILVRPEEDIPSFLTSSLFGFHEIDATAAPYETWATSPSSSLFVRAIKDEYIPELVYFEVSSSVAGVTAVTSSKMSDIYNDERWHFSVEMTPQNAVSFVTSSLSDYNLIFRGYSYNGNVLNRSFEASSSVARATALSFVQANQKLYAGSRRQDFVGTLLDKSDVRIANLRFWLTDLSTDELKAHALDPSNAGVINNDSSLQDLTSSLLSTDIYRNDYCILDWSFSQITSSAASGKISILDSTSGSAQRRARGGYVNTLAGYQYPGTSYEFPASSANMVYRDFETAYSPVGIDNYNSDNLIEIKSIEEERFGLNRKFVTFITNIEKSVQGAITEEMLKMFSSVKELATLVGTPVNKYRPDYKDLRALRERFFENISNDIDPEKFLKFYRWLDSSLHAILTQLVPASTEFNDDVFTVIESHVLERNKYQYKFPTAEFRQPDPIDGAESINKSLINWKYYHAPLEASTSYEYSRFEDFSTAPRGFLNNTGAGADGTLPPYLTANTGTTNAGGEIRHQTSSARTAYRFAGGYNAGVPASFPYLGTSNKERALILSTWLTGTLTGSFLYAHGDWEDYAGSDADAGNNFNLNSPAFSSDSEALRLQYATSSAATGSDWRDILVITASAGTAGGWLTGSLAFAGPSGSETGDLYRIRWAQLGYGSTAAAYPGTSQDNWAITALNLTGTGIVATTTYVPSTDQALNCKWWSERVNRSSSAVTSGDAGVDADREQIRDVIYSAINRSYTTPQRFKVDDLYVGKDTREATYWSPAIQEFGAIVDVDGPGPLTASVSRDYLLVQASSIVSKQDCDDVLDPNLKVQKGFKVENSREFNESYSYGKGHLLAPFTMWSSSINSGYQSSLSSFASDIGLNNLHDDVYCRFKNAPLQGPFTEGWIGGWQYRHIEYNTGSDQQGNRPEGFYLLYGPGPDGASSLGIVKTSYTTTGIHDSATPRAALMREETAKRPLNIKNIQYTTSSRRLGNFRKNYEVVMTNGRTENNFWFHDNSAQALTESEVWNLNRGTTSPYLNATLPTLGVQKSVIVNRFAAPGGPEITSRGYLNPAGEEYSPSNALPFRNTRVLLSSGSGNNDFTGSDPRVNIYTNILTQNDGLRVLLSRHSGLYGIDSVYGAVQADNYTTTGSYQKVNRNAFSQSTGINYDNFFVSHQIPRTPAGYSWVRSALSGSSGSFSYVLGATPATEPSGSTSIEIPFAVLNNLLETPAASSPTTPAVLRSALGYYTSSTAIAANEVGNILTSFFASRVDVGSTPIENTLSTRSAGTNVEMQPLDFIVYANSINNNLFGYSSFIQTRGGDTRQARSMKENNTFSYRFKFPPIPGAGGTISPRDYIVRNINMPPVVEEFPLTHKLQTLDNTKINSQYSFGNEYVYYPLANNTERILYAISGMGSVKEKKQTLFNFISDLYTSPVPGGVAAEYEGLTYKQNIWPKSQYTYRQENRQRTQFTIDWWSSSRVARTQNDVTNSLGSGVQTQSVWIIDGIENPSAYTPIDIVVRSQYGAGRAWLPVGATLTNLTSSQILGSGASQNSGMIFYANLSGTIDGFYLANDIDNSNHLDNALPLRWQPLYARPTAVINLTSSGLPGTASAVQIIGGTPWTAPAEAGKEPFYYKDYNDYVLDMRTAGKDYSVIPEFRISETIADIIDGPSGSNTVLTPTFDITGAFYPNDTNEAFYTEFVDSDFLKYFNIIENKHDEAEIESRGTLKLSCKALKKFLPYEGFYPAQRVEQLAMLFSQSYSNSVYPRPVTNDSHYAGSGIALGGTHPFLTFNDYPSLQVDKDGFRPFFMSYVAPGLLCNSIKSGIGISYPIFTSSFLHQADTTGSLATKGWSASISPVNITYDHIGARIKRNFDYKLPFESLMDPLQAAPEFYADCEPHESSLIRSRTQVFPDRAGDNLFAYAVNNFAAESMNLFLKNNTVSSLISAGENAFSFDTSKEYNMLISLTQEDMTMYAGDKSFGPPVDSFTGSSYAPYLPSYNTFYKDKDTGLEIEASEALMLTFKPQTPNPNIDVLISSLTASLVNRSTTGSFPAPGAQVAFDNRMTVQDSIVWNRKVQVGRSSTARPAAPEFALAIQPKWETPILDFTHRSASVTLTEDFYNSSSADGYAASGSTNNYYVGMWHQYGRIPTGSQGIKMKISDGPNTDTDRTGSLADALSFSKLPVKLGQLNNTIVKEAIVAVPYTVVDNEKRFFKIDERSFRLAAFGSPSARSEISTEFINLAEKMKNYVFPPRMDFYNRTNRVNPFAMFVFEFGMELDEQDLADIWQNLPPSSNVGKKQLNSRFEKEESSFEVSYGTEDSWFPEGIPEGTRWMVFKVKQRAAYDYFEQLRKSSLAQGKTNELEPLGAFTNPTYSYNWPYDFFSFVELAKTTAEVELGEASTPSLRERAREEAAAGAERGRERASRTEAEEDATSGDVPAGVGASRGRGGGFFTD